MKVTRPIVVNTVLAVAILVVAGGGVLLVAHPFSPSATGKITQLTATVRRGTVSATINASGSIAPIREITSSFPVSGTIATVAVAPGSVVTVGQTLGSLDTTPLAKALSSARSSLATATAQLAGARLALSVSSTIVPLSAHPGQGAQVGASQSTGSSASSVASARSQVTSAQGGVATAQEAVDTATVNLADATLTAPIAGLVVAVSGTVGDSTLAGSIAETVAPTGTIVTAGTSGGGKASGSVPSGFVTIADTSHLTVTAGIAEADVASVTVGLAATVVFPALSGQSATATVSSIAPIATTNNSVVSYPTTITLGTAAVGLRLGQTAEVVITTRASSASALYVPTAAITTANGISTVKVVAKDGTTSVATVTLGIAGDVGTRVATGLNEGETVVIGTVSASTTGIPPQGRFGNRRGFGGGSNGFGGGTVPGGTTAPGSRTGGSTAPSGNG